MSDFESLWHMWLMENYMMSKEKRGSPCKENIHFINAVFWPYNSKNNKVLWYSHILCSTQYIFSDYAIYVKRFILVWVGLKCIHNNTSYLDTATLDFSIKIYLHLILHAFSSINTIRMKNWCSCWLFNIKYMAIYSKGQWISSCFSPNYIQIDALFHVWRPEIWFQQNQSVTNVTIRYAWLLNNKMILEKREIIL